ncbi:hypothetical protein B0H63DRAFT_441812, partial [Podospora didyma]
MAISTSLVLITGGTGFIGSQVVLDALKAGHRVRLTIRREAQVDEVKSRFASYATQLETALTPDLSSIDAIRSALGDDVEYVIHIASPMPGKGDDFKTDYLHPAVKGTEAILEAAATALAVKRVVIMSSLLGLMPLGAMRIPGIEVKAGANKSIPIDPDMPFPSGPAGHGMKYSASKVLAHRATLDWVSTHKPHFSLITIHPSLVLGHDMTQTGTTAGGSNAFLTNSLATPPPSGPIVPSSFVDVRDVSLVTLRSLDVSVPFNNDEVREYLVTGKPTTWDAIIAFVK